MVGIDALTVVPTVFIEVDVTDPPRVPFALMNGNGIGFAPGARVEDPNMISGGGAEDSAAEDSAAEVVSVLSTSLKVVVPAGVAVGLGVDV